MIVASQKDVLFKGFDIELKKILDYWESHTLDNDNAGFVGQINFKNERIEKASKGLILNTRILWSFSAVSNQLNTQEYAAICHRAYHYLALFFKDKSDGSLYWELECNAKPKNTHKKSVGQAYALLALCEYYVFSKKEVVKSWAIALFEQIEQFGFDAKNKRYVDVLYTGEKDPVHDIKGTKSLGTHLHLLEAYTALLKLQANTHVEKQLRFLVKLILDDFITTKHHCETALDTNGESLSETVFFGYNVEVPWMLVEAAKALGDTELLYRTKENLLQMVDVFLEEAIDKNGAVIYGKCIKTQQLDTDLHWWTQIEGLVGMLYAYSFTKDDRYLASFNRIWIFVKEHFIDLEHGEWFARLAADTTKYQDDKIGMWKSPYHSTRMCLKIMAFKKASEEVV